LATGRARTRVPAYQDINTSEGVQQVRLLISTEKVGDAVLLRIDEMAPAELAESG